MPAPSLQEFASPGLAEAWLAAQLAPDGLEGGALFQERLVIVPSRSLREGLAAQLCRRQRAWLGVSLVTLQGLVYRILQAAGERPSLKDGLLPVFVARALFYGGERFAALGELARLDRLGPLVATVRDLLDAGFTPAHQEALAELLETIEQGRGGGKGYRAGGDALTGRARALLTLTATVAELMAREGVQRRSDLVVRATEIVRQKGFPGSPAAVFAFGFADVTGIVGDFLEALSKTVPFFLLLVEPPDPVVPGVPAGGSFTGRLRARFGVAQARQTEEHAFPALALWQAPGIVAEVRWVAEDIARLLAQGVPAEELGVVARDLGPYATMVRRVFRELGVPFSGFQKLPQAHPARWRLSQLSTLVELGERAPVSSLLALLQGRAEENTYRLLERAVANLGGHTLGELLSRLAGQDAEGLAENRVLAELRACLATLPEAAQAWRFAAVCQGLGELCGLPPEADALWQQALVAAQEEAQGLVISREEWSFLLSQTLEEVLALPLGGAGGGVQVLSVMEARFRRFRKLYCLGMMRDLFPRLPQEDPLLPDFLRNALAVLLPDIPLASRSPEEERYLFGLLLASAPEVWLSWPAWDEDGKERARSPYIEELLAARPQLRVGTVPPPWQLVLSEGPRLAPPESWAVAAGLAGERRAWRRACELFFEGLAETKELGSHPRKLAVGRASCLAEWDPPLPSGLRVPSPYLGFLGPSEELAGEEATFWITFWEVYATCPWQSFLVRLLRLGAPRDPVGHSLAGSHRLRGELVHRVLARIVRQRLGEASEPWHRRAPQPVPWPEEAHLVRWLEEEASALLAERAVAWPGMVVALAASARPFLERARELLFPGGEGWFLAAEETSPVFAGKRWRFRFDAAQREGETLVLLDFKTGKAAKKEAGQREHLITLWEREGLQGAAYAVAGRGVGRYLYLHPEHEGEPKQDVVYAPEVANTLREALWFFQQAAEQGLFFPRLVDPKNGAEPEACKACPVAAACSRGESGARRRLLSWGQSLLDRPTAGERVEERLFYRGRFREVGG